jgi:hypothetical protein
MFNKTKEEWIVTIATMIVHSVFTMIVIAVTALFIGWKGIHTSEYIVGLIGGLFVGSVMNEVSHTKKGKTNG